MKLAVSNIAWAIEQDEAVAEMLVQAGVTGIEVAPTKLWPDPLEATDAQIDACRRTWEARGLPIIAAQALLFGKPELTLFENAQRRTQTLEYLHGIVRICGRLGARALVFGSPKNRRVGGGDRVGACFAASDFFGQLGKAAAAAGTSVVIEANPTDYGADFLTRAGEAIDLVRAVDHPGIRLHLDTGCMTLSDDPIEETFTRAGGLLRHFHVSEPHLAPVGQGSVDHPAFARALARINYPHWISVEMRPPEPFAPERLFEVAAFVRSKYRQLPAA